MKLKKKPYKILIQSPFMLFLRDFKLPLGATAVFLVIVLGLLLTRIYERSTLATALASDITVGQDYAALLNSAKATGVVTNPTNKTPETSGTATGSPAITSAAAFTVTPISSSASTTIPTTTGTTTTSGGSTGSGSGGSGTSGGNTTPAAPFSASISDFNQSGAPVQECNGGLGGGIVGANCTRTYSFVATVKTVNGPGTVTYKWSSNAQSETIGSFTVVNKESSTSVPYTITLSCKNPTTIDVQFAVITPTPSKQRLSVPHQCTGLPG